MEGEASRSSKSTPWTFAGARGAIDDFGLAAYRKEGLKPVTPENRAAAILCFSRF